MASPQPWAVGAEDKLSSYAWHKGWQDGEGATALPCAGRSVQQCVTAGLELDKEISVRTSETQFHFILHGAPLVCVKEAGL